MVDTAAREIEWSELYLVEQRRGPIIWQVCDEPAWSREKREHPGRVCAMLRPLNRPASWEETEEIIKATPQLGLIPLHLSDGPIYLDCLQEQIIGRVVGIYQTEALPMRKAENRPQS